MAVCCRQPSSRAWLITARVSRARSPCCATRSCCSPACNRSARSCRRWSMRPRRSVFSAITPMHRPCGPASRRRADLAAAMNSMLPKPGCIWILASISLRMRRGPPNGRLPPRPPKPHQRLRSRRQPPRRLRDRRSWMPVPTPAPLETLPGSPLAVLPPLRPFLQLLDEIAAKQDRKGARDREAFREFRRRYQWLARSGSPLWLTRHEQRMARLTHNKQPVLVALAVTPRRAGTGRCPVRPGDQPDLVAVPGNPRAIAQHRSGIRQRGPGGFPAPAGRPGRPTGVSGIPAGAGRTGAGHIPLELDLLDHRGAWHAYRGPAEIRLIPASQGEAGWGEEQRIPRPSRARPILAGRPGGADKYSRSRGADRGWRQRHGLHAPSRTDGR